MGEKRKEDRNLERVCGRDSREVHETHNISKQEKISLKNNYYFSFTIAALLGEKRGFETGEVVKQVVTRLLVDHLASSQFPILV